MIDFEKTSAEFLEVASETRLRILFELLKKPSRVTVMAKKFNVTAQEIHRNFERMVNTGLITKAKSFEEVIGVLAHETGHIALGHV